MKTRSLYKQTKEEPGLGLGIGQPTKKRKRTPDTTFTPPITPSDKHHQTRRNYYASLNLNQYPKHNSSIPSPPPTLDIEATVKLMHSNFINYTRLLCNEIEINKQDLYSLKLELATIKSTLMNI